MGKKDDYKTLLWWRILSVMSVFNIIMWISTFLTVDTKNDNGYSIWHVCLSGVFTIVCAFRSIVPRADTDRYCIIDSWVSSIVAGRSAATVAEISFATQIGLIMHEIGGSARYSWVQSLTVPVIVLLSTAQCLCWYGIITRNNMAHVIEESLWAFTFVMVGVALGVCAPHLDAIWQEICYLGVVLCVAYVYFMVTVDIPMYYKRWCANNTHGNHKYYGLKEGFHDALTHRVVTLDWELWKPEVAWLSGYFTGAVFVSIGLSHLPRA